MGSFYTVHATAGDPFEQFAGFEGLNPQDAQDIRIVVRLAATVRGRVLDAQTEEPITNFRAQIGAVDSFGRGRSSILLEATPSGIAAAGAHERRSEA